MAGDAAARFDDAEGAGCLCFRFAAPRSAAGISPHGFRSAAPVLAAAYSEASRGRRPPTLIFDWRRRTGRRALLERESAAVALYRQRFAPTVAGPPSLAPTSRRMSHAARPRRRGYHSRYRPQAASAQDAHWSRRLRGRLQARPRMNTSSQRSSLARCEAGGALQICRCHLPDILGLLH